LKKAREKSVQKACIGTIRKAVFLTKVNEQVLDF